MIWGPPRYTHTHPHTQWIVTHLSVIKLMGSDQWWIRVVPCFRRGNWLWWVWVFFTLASPLWTLTREVLQCRFHLNVNLKAISLRRAWMLMRLESRFAHNRYAKLCRKKPTDILFSQRAHISVFLLFAQKDFGPLLSFLCDDWRPMGENKALWWQCGS